MFEIIQVDFGFLVVPKIVNITLVGHVTNAVVLIWKINEGLQKVSVYNIPTVRGFHSSGP